MTFDEWWSQHCENHGLTEIPWADKHHAKMAWDYQETQLQALREDYDESVSRHEELIGCAMKLSAELQALREKPDYPHEEIAEMQNELQALREAASRAKVLLDDATYHDGRYGQHTDTAWQKEACEVSNLLEHSNE